MVDMGTVYLKCERSCKVEEPVVRLGSLGSIHCKDREMEKRLEQLEVHRFKKGDSQRCVISCLRLVKLVEKVWPDARVEIVGETDTLVEWEKMKGTPNQWWKIVLVCLVSFFGTAFAIMTYHNDVGITSVFDQIYGIVLGQEVEGVGILEFSYSLGLGGGIVIFFNHVGGHRITKDPTPIEVALRNYEEDVDKTLITTASRENREEE